ncbi:MAG: Spo0E family sporulation regulatory protein-aspartic acid phosphatase [Senegalia sp. (in: firmicutes)]
MDKSILLKLNNTRESLNNLIGKNSNELTNLEVVKLSQEQAYSSSPNRDE